ncbi:MAG: phosphate acyltransferase PlsX [Oscillospiraceae bacterium]|jgi:glycerol-3-phosphate acyltransferase PlsX|nr:phosphate acyltransferase PlsX [Oscillospiraceae bacterium]
MKIILDAMGGDNAPGAVAEGALKAMEQLGVDIILVGRAEDILRALQKLGRSSLPRGLEILDAEETIEMDDDPLAAVREKRGSSMVVALNRLAEGGGDALVSAGSTGALLSGATLIVKRVRGIRRAALAPFLPGAGGGFLIIDCGANAECTPEYLLQFAYMGSFYAESALGVARPRVALLNNGAESSKGTPLQIEAHRLLSAAGAALNFTGNVEGNEVMAGKCDVVVCDGFSGNILLKTIEGAAKFILGEMKSALTQNARTKLSALLLKSELSELKRRFNADRVGGTVLLGISKPVIKAHGSSGADAICGAVRQAALAAGADVPGRLKENIERMKLDPERGVPLDG